MRKFFCLILSLLAVSAETFVIISGYEIAMKLYSQLTFPVLPSVPWILFGATLLLLSVLFAAAIPVASVKVVRKLCS